MLLHYFIMPQPLAVRATHLPTLFYGFSLNFLLDPQNLALIGIAVASGAFLFGANLRGRSGNAARSTLEATQLINQKNAVIVDVRSADEFNRSSLIGARNIPADELARRHDELARYKNRAVLLVCQTGAPSGRAVAQLSKEGFTEVYNLAGGINAWEVAGLPLAKPVKESAGSPAKKEK